MAKRRYEYKLYGVARLKSMQRRIVIRGGVAELERRRDMIRSSVSDHHSTPSSPTCLVEDKNTSIEKGEATRAFKFIDEGVVKLERLD